MRKCKICLKNKRITSFYVRKGKYKNLYSYCIECTNKNSKKYFLKNKKKSIEYVKKWRLNNAEQAKLTARIRNLRNAYKMTLEQYNDLLIKQDNKCKICKKQPNIYLAVDHCHKTQKVRGLLCFNCNSGLGHFKDSIDSLIAAYNYLLEHEG